MIIDENYINVPFVDDNIDITDFKWSDYIDKVYIMSIPRNKDKAKIVHYELNRIGIEDKYIIESYNILSPLYKYIYQRIYQDQYHEKEFHILLNHYMIIKQAYELGYNRIMICEDDIRFLKNVDIIKQQIKQLDFNKIDYIWLHKGTYGLIIVSAACYILNRTAMKDWIDYIENSLFSDKFIPNDVIHIFMKNHSKYWLESDICICVDTINNTNDYKWTNIQSLNNIYYKNIYKESDYNI